MCVDKCLMRAEVFITMWLACIYYLNLAMQFSLEYIEVTMDSMHTYSWTSSAYLRMSVHVHASPHLCPGDDNTPKLNILH